jgi:NAD(P)-dependent dehydrogenase (short-subunit alcohol dehydrogenase family)
VNDKQARRLEGHVAAITGGGQGIGRAAALAFADEGASVVVADVNPKSASDTAREVRERGTEALAADADVTSGTSVAELIRRTKEEFGRLDCLVNNAGIYPVLGGVVETSEADWDATVDVSLKGTYLCSKHAIPEMARTGGGSIINVSSTFALLTDQGSAAYTAAKAGVIGLTRCCAVDYAHLNIRCNCVAPGGIVTEGVGSSNRQAPGGDYWNFYRAGTFSTFDKERNYSDEEVSFIQENRWKAKVLGRPGSARELAAVMVFLASSESSWITGAVIPVDGGETILLPSTVIRNLTATGAY